MLRKLPLALAAALATSAWAQSVISAKSGMIHYVEGQVVLDGAAVQPKFAEFPEVKVGQTLAAEDGRAEILLTPGVFLRLAENSSFKMISNKLADTRVEIVSGSAVIEVGELLQDNAILVLFNGAEIALAKRGLFRIDADPGRLRVYEGEARVTSSSGDTIVAKKGREVQFGAVLEARNFDLKQTDAFYRWSARRDEYVAQANVSAARSASYSSGSGYGSGYGYGNGFGGLGYGSGSWAWNPWFGMFTYIPMNGMYYSPFGYAYFSPGSVYSIYSGYGYGYGSGGGRSPSGSSSSGTYAATTSRLNTTAVNSASRGSINSPSFGSNSGGSFGSQGGSSTGGFSTSTSTMGGSSVGGAARPSSSGGPRH